jgi:putative membrane protein
MKGSRDAIRAGIARSKTSFRKMMTNIAPPPKRPPAAQSAVVGILLLSMGAIVFLLWLIYIHPAIDESGDRYAFLPGLNALLNGMSAVALTAGFTFIRLRKINAHWRAMTTAFAFSTMFLVSYILHHALHGDVHYPVHAAYRGLYLSLLASHIILATVALPMILVTFFFSLTRRFPQHKKLARWTFPVWLYVSVTGVITYAMLHAALGRG